jgi:hypothetical protein
MTIGFYTVVCFLGSDAISSYNEVIFYFLQLFRPPPASHKHDNKYKYKRKEVIPSSSSDGPKRRLGCSVCNSELHTEVSNRIVESFCITTKLLIV